jgi:predicted amidohydrolase YtcJ
VPSHYPAENLVGRHATGYGNRTEEQRFEDIEQGQELCLQAGYTSIQDVIVGSPADVMVYKKFAESGRLRVRVYLMLYLSALEQAEFAAQICECFESDRLKFGGWKLAMDGGSAHPHHGIGLCQFFRDHYWLTGTGEIRGLSGLVSRYI